MIPDTSVECNTTDMEMNFLKNKTIDKAIHQKLRKNDVYKIDMHKIYNLIVGQKNEQPQDKEALDATFQTVKIDQDPLV